LGRAASAAAISSKRCNSTCRCSATNHSHAIGLQKGGEEEREMREEER
jgi:hypothetical protein